MTLSINKTAVLAFAICLYSFAPVISQDQIDFNQQIRPILVKKCFACHGADEETREGGLGLHLRDLATGELDSGEIGIVPGKPDESEVLRRICSDDEFERMPPEEASPPLTDQEQELIRRWITEGANYDKHWSFKPTSRPKTPTVSSEDWCINPIDQFVMHRLDTQHLHPAKQASRETLIRRLSLDLTGLPPTPEETQAFLSDRSEDRYERLVDRLLDSPRFGEHWARPWLDLARYADSQGYAQDEIRTVWPYRDWVIKAINDDMPFDQFTVEQLSGDLLDQPTTSQLVATGFHRNTMTNTEGGTDDEEFRHAAIVDRVNTTAQVWLGLTMGCAQCHTHKFDPITQEEYYRVFAVFNQTADNDQPDNRPTIPYLTDQDRKRLAKLKTELKRLTELNPESPTDLDELAQKINELKKEITAIASYRTPVMQELESGKQRKTHIAIRGAFADLGDEVSPGLPVALSSTTPEDRLELAKWLVSAENPLTPRVAANRIWQQIFGLGLVETSEDFGAQGTLPSHPQLLDWLATELIENGWSRKKLIKTIVMSATYQQSSESTVEKNKIDPANQLLSRGARYRLSAEQIRDYALSTAGLLSRKMYGPPVRPPQPKSGLNAAFGGTLDWEPSHGEDRYRRAIYTLWRRTNPYPSFMALDAVDRRVCTVRRIETNTPVAAFVTLNDPVFVELAVATAQRILASADANKINFSFQLVVGRQPNEDESKLVNDLYQQQLKKYSDNVEGAKELVSVYQPATKVPNEKVAELASWTVVANTLLNLDEALTRN